MSTSAGSSVISVAEEVTETYAHGGAGGGDLTGNLDGAEPADAPLRMADAADSVVAPSAVPQSSNMAYDPIKPDHLSIIDLQVDPQLKPHHLLATKTSSWLAANPVLEERRRKCIVQYLSETDRLSDSSAPHSPMAVHLVAGHQYGSHVSVDQLNTEFRSVKARRSSVDDNLFRWGESSSSRDVVGDSMRFTLTDCHEPSRLDGGGPMSEIMGQLDFQVTQRNERSHFIVAELLIQTIEFLYSDELLRRSSSTFTFRNSSGILVSAPSKYGCGRSSPVSLLQTSLTDSQLSLNATSVACALSSPPSHSIVEPASCSSRAETLAEMVLDDVLYCSPFVNVRDKLKRGVPASLRLLMKRLDRHREFSSGEKQERLRPRQRPSDDMDADASSKSMSLLSECANEKIKALVETCSYPLNIPVGQYPELGPNQSLPTYVVTMSPAFTSQSTILALQNNTCPGCQLEFSSDTARRLRLCRYYGFYFCSVCHSNTLMLIPARVLSNWDFTMLPVSCFARDLLKLIHSEPLFSLEHFSEKLRHSLPVLRSVLRLRLQGRLLLDFIETCRQGLSLKRVAVKFPSHWLSNSSPKFSLADFQLMESGLMVQELKEFASGCVEHISICPLCQAHGFLCELCHNKSEVIFPFEIDKVHQCGLCHACSHLRCHEQAKSQPCLKCERRKLREEQIRTATAAVTTLSTD